MKRLDEDELSNHPQSSGKTRSHRKPPTKPPVPRDEQLKRAAQMRAAIISLLNNSDGPMGRTEITDKLMDKAKELQYDSSSFDNFLFTMSKNGLIRNLGKNPLAPGNLYASLKYQDPNSNNVAPPNNANPNAVRTYKSKKRKQEQYLPVEKEIELERLRADNRIRQMHESPAPPVNIDIVKSTGRIRVSIGGMAIEIGVVD